MDKITLNLSVEQINIILMSLSKQPYEAVAPLIGEIQKQAEPQVTPTKDGE